MIDTRNPIQSNQAATTESGEKIVLVRCRNESTRKVYKGEGVSGIIRRWIGETADGRLYMGRSLKSMRCVTHDAPAAAAVCRGLSQ
jgi:hypothetical protein